MQMNLNASSVRELLKVLLRQTWQLQSFGGLFSTWALEHLLPNRADPSSSQALLLPWKLTWLPKKSFTQHQGQSSSQNIAWRSPHT
jgi:hypothetical protein